MRERRVIVVAGPTASGKSALALALAGALDGVVINADSLQLYDGLRILTARPDPAIEAKIPHRLYGVIGPDEDCSAGRWRDMAETACREAWAAGRLPIVTGGTGLYIRALLEGLAPVPVIPDAVRRQTRALFRDLGNQAFHARLAAIDPLMAARLDPGNSQRLMRAHEVMTATGRSLADWQKEPPSGRLEAESFTVTLLPPRETLYQACDGRFLAMIEEGALDEVRGLVALGLGSDRPIQKALGFAELAAHLAGRLGLNEAIAAAQQATRRYAKRQFTWFRHQLPAQETLFTQYSESFAEKIIPLIRLFLLTAR